MTGEIINFYSETSFDLPGEEKHREWLKDVVRSEGKNLDEVSFIFCDDQYLLKLNQEYLDHDTYTDIISFDNSLGNTLAGDIFISVDRVKENAIDFGVEFEEELRRVLVHGILHLSGYKDKTEEESSLMRQKEEEKMKMFHVEQ